MILVRKLTLAERLKRFLLPAYRRRMEAEQKELIREAVLNPGYPVLFKDE